MKSIACYRKIKPPRSWKTKRWIIRTFGFRLNGADGALGKDQLMEPEGQEITVMMEYFLPELCFVLYLT